MKNLLGKVKKRMGLLLGAMVAIMALAIPMSASAAPSPEPIDFSSTTGFGVTVPEIIDSAWSFIAEFDTFTMLVLAIMLVSTLVGFIIWLVSKLPKFRKSSS